MHQLTQRQTAQLHSHDLVWKHCSDENIRKLHNSLANCVHQALLKYPKMNNRDTFISLLATYIKEWDDQIPGLARQSNMNEDELCILFAKATYGHEKDTDCGGEI
jgi:hypothetical protein